MVAQRSFEELGTPLSEVTFVVVDLETTGASPATCAITEVGAVKLRGGECLGRFQTLVNPGVAIPPQITYLTGITDSMVGPAPLIEPVLASFEEFLGNAVLVGHNVRFDISFLEAVRARNGQGRMGNGVVDTCSLARRLVRDEVRDCRLATLSRHFRLDHQPTHRALDDALATGELLHHLLERAAGLGVLGLDDLVALPAMTGHPEAGKLRLTTRLPRAAGVYLFRDAVGHVLYVGRATNLRQRVRSYFSTDERRKIGGLLRQTAAIDHVECSGVLETVAAEARLIRHLTPRYNRQGKSWNKYAYVKLTLNERFPRLSVVRRARPGDGCLYLGPVASMRSARALVEAIETAVPIRACRNPIRSARVGSPGPSTPGIPDPGPLVDGRSRAPRRDGPRCPTRALGLRRCPCEGGVSEDDYRPVVDAVVVGFTVDPWALLAPLAARMRGLADHGRFEEAADVRDRAALLGRALTRQRRVDSLRAAGRVSLQLDDGTAAVIVDARLLRAERTPVRPGNEPRAQIVGMDLRQAIGARSSRGQGEPPIGLAPARPAGLNHGAGWREVIDGLGPLSSDTARWPAPLPLELADEAAALASWLESNAHRVRVLEVEHGWALPARTVPDFTPGDGTTPSDPQADRLGARHDAGRVALT